MNVRITYAFPEMRAAHRFAFAVRDAASFDVFPETDNKKIAATRAPNSSEVVIEADFANLDRALQALKELVEIVSPRAQPAPTIKEL